MQFFLLPMFSHRQAFYLYIYIYIYIYLYYKTTNLQVRSVGVPQNTGQIMSVILAKITQFVANTLFSKILLAPSEIFIVI